MCQREEPCGSASQEAIPSWAFEVTRTTNRGWYDQLTRITPPPLTKTVKKNSPGTLWGLFLISVPYERATL
jgi:hypothetical protein